MAIIFTSLLGTTRADNTLLTFRNVIPITGGALDEVSVTFQSGSATWVVQNASIGIWTGTDSNTTATPVELKFGGASGFNLASAFANAVSDWVALTGFTSSDKLVVILDYAPAGGAVDSDQSTAGLAMRFQFGGSSYNVASDTAMGGFGSVPWNVGVKQIDTRSTGGGGGGAPVAKKILNSQAVRRASYW